MTSGERIASGLFGGILLGVWIYGLLFGFSDWGTTDVAKWFTWGLLGLAIAGAVYGTRAASQLVRLVMVVIIGIVVAIVVLAAILNENGYVVATLATVLGGSLVGSALPAPHAWDAAAAPEGQDG